jgi:hypothetical protein
MSATLIPERLAEIASVQLQHGSHYANAEHAMCVMEAVAYVAGETWSDAPRCACPVITAFMVSWNDSLPDADRTRLLAPLIPLLVGTRSTPAVEERRSYMALDWLIRVHTPKWMEMVPALREHADNLRGMEEIADMSGATAAGVKISAARAAAVDAAWYAAGDATRDATRDAAGDSARAAAWYAAVDAAVAAAWYAAGDSARAAAWYAAVDAAVAAAWYAAGGEMKPTTQWLQDSAVDLVKRMCEVKA